MKVKKNTLKIISKNKVNLFYVYQKKMKFIKYLNQFKI